MLPSIKEVLKDFQADQIVALEKEVDDLRDIYQLIDDAICEEPPLSARDGGIIKDGFYPEIDRLRKAKTEGKQWLAQLEAQERERTGIKNLKIKYNKVFGYYLEVTN